MKPEICTSETIATLSADLERTFVRLWTHCDDEGRCRDNTRLIKAAIYPLLDEITPDVLDAQLDGLVRAGLVRRYEVDGQRVLVVTNFTEHQRPQKKQPSKLPAPPDSDPTPPADKGETATGPVQDAYGSPTVPVSEGCGPVVVDVDVVVEGENTRASAGSQALAVVHDGSPPMVAVSESSRSKPTLDEAWSTWWATYPKKVGKQAARKAWDRARKRRTVPELQSALESHLPAWATIDEQFIPHPATWLGQGRYDDPPPKPRATTSKPNRVDENMARIQASMQRMEAHG